MTGQAPLRTGDVLHIPGTGPAHDRSRGHFHVIIADTEDGATAVLVPICTEHERCDRTCILEAGEHSCVKHRSYILYAKMRYFLVSHLQEKVDAGIIEVLRAPASPEITQRIQAGVLVSSFSPPTYQRFVKNALARTAANETVAEPEEEVEVLPSGRR